MMHHPNMHHQPMSGHPPQHMGGHQAMPAHHQMPPHQMHRENRHVTLTRVPLGGSQAGGGMGGHGPALGALGGMVPHHAPAPRAPHPLRPMTHHPPSQHHSVPPQQMKPLRRPYMGGGYGPPFPQQHHHGPHHQPQSQQLPQHQHTRLCRSPILSPPTKRSSDFGQLLAVSTSSNSVTTNTNGVTIPEASASTVLSASPGAGAGGGGGAGGCEGGGAGAAAGEGEAARPAAAQANSKEKTPMCLVNELARYNKIKHQYRLTSESGPAHKKIFTVTLRLSDTEEYTAEGSSIKRAQHAAAHAALDTTGYPAPPPRAAPAHAPPHPHHRHSGAVMPTVELNALAMKLCQPAVYTSVPPVAAGGAARGGGRGARGAGGGAGAGAGGAYRGPFLGVFPRLLAPPLVYRVRVAVGGRVWLGEGGTPQAARHDAAARALQDLRPPPDQHSSDPPPTDVEPGEGSDLLNSEVKSPVSLVHELALKRSLSVQFSVKSERGPPHMRVFITTCTVGDMETEGEGNGKKVSKRRAAERMVDEMRRRWPPALLRARTHTDKRAKHPAKKKPRNLIKEGGAAAAESSEGSDNPISRLAVARHAVRARSPQYRVLEERGAARRREFLVQCDAPPHAATGLGPNKKTAKRRAAHNVLLAMELNVTSPPAAAALAAASADTNTAVAGDTAKTSSTDTKQELDSEGGAGGAAGEVRQPVPGVLMMDYHQRAGQPAPPNGVSETSATGGAGGTTPGAKDQLMYLSQLLGFTVQFSDFPKRNHGEYLSLVSLSTEPPVMCHGGGPSTAHSHEQCARAALRALALMGLDAPAPAPAAAPAPTAPGTQNLPNSGAKLNVLSNGITE